MRGLRNGARLGFLVGLAALMLGVFATGCYISPAVGVDAEYEVSGPPPAVQDEAVVVQPGPEFVWIGGYWNWDVRAKTFTWRGGRWERPPHAHAVWEAPHYELRNGHHYWRPGHWRQ
jgi:hypothetical protein